MKMLVLICGLISFSSYSAEIKVPAKNLLNAAQTIKYQTGPYYSVNGDIECVYINSGWGPVTSSCEINIDGATANVEKPESLINAVAKFKVPTGPHYSFSGKFKASSLSAQMPPYKVTESATVILE